MSESQPTHLLNVRVQNWTAHEYRQPGRIIPSGERWSQYRGTMDDCDAIAAAHGAPTLWSDSPENKEFPFHDKTYLHMSDEGDATEVWCRGRRLDITGTTPWIDTLPIAGEVFDSADTDGR